MAESEGTAWLEDVTNILQFYGHTDVGEEHLGLELNSGEFEEDESEKSSESEKTSKTSSKESEDEGPFFQEKDNEEAVEESEPIQERSVVTTDPSDIFNDPVKENLILQSTLFNELEKNKAIVKEIVKYFEERKEEVVYIPSSYGNKELKQMLKEEIETVKEIMNLFESTYDNTYCKIMEVKEHCEEGEKILDFLTESSKKMLDDLQKKVDKKILDKLTQGKGFDRFMEIIFQTEEKVAELLAKKAVAASRIEHMKHIIHGSGSSSTFLGQKPVDLMHLAQVQKQANTAADLKFMQEIHVRKMQKIFNVAIDKVPFKFHEMRYNQEMKEIAEKNFSKFLQDNHEARKKALDELNKSIFMKQRKMLLKQKARLQTVGKYLTRG